jgi:hypothetical protein
MNPPIVYDETRPSIQRMIKMTAMVSSIVILPQREVAPLGNPIPSDYSRINSQRDST